ncbi:flagellin [Microvirga sp. TS319]|uniref:flagellin N-terminal helical domain-containing protein n=1 Tax=Microvirga sp. TS319 TaxID=3241165 RepID=UPI00351A0A98
MSSINTNLSAMTALQALKATQSAMNKNQNQISTGLRVGEASHNASYWSIATAMKSDNGALSAVKDAIGQSKAMINTFTSAMDKTLTYLNKMKAGLVAATQPGADLAKIQTEFDAHIAGMKSAAGSASFNGQNWLAGVAETVMLVTSYDGSTNSVGTLSIDTSKTKLFTNTTAGTGGILNDVAQIKLISTFVDVTVPSGAETDDKIAIKIGVSAEQEHRLTSGDASDLNTLVKSINDDVRFNTQVKAAVVDGQLRITSLDPSVPVTATYLKKPAADGAATPVAPTYGSDGLPGGIGPAADTYATLTFDDTDLVTDLRSANLSQGDEIKFTVDGVPKTFTVGAETDLLQIASSINGTVPSYGVVADASSGKLVLRGLTPGDTGTVLSAGSYTNYTRTAGVPGSSPIAESLAFVDEAIQQVTAGSAMLGANKALLETQEEFIGVLSDSLTAGVSSFVDADMNEASTRNQALQTQQQLGVQALSMANQNSQMILKLFQ